MYTRPDLFLIKYEKIDNRTTMSYLDDMSGNIIYKSKNFGTKIYTSNSIKRVIVYDNKQTLIFDDKYKLIATIDLIFKQISINFLGYMECKNESKKIVFLGPDFLSDSDFLNIFLKDIFFNLFRYLFS